MQRLANAKWMPINHSLASLKQVDGADDQMRCLSQKALRKCKQLKWKNIYVVAGVYDYHMVNMLIATIVCCQLSVVYCSMSFDQPERRGGGRLASAIWLFGLLFGSLFSLIRSSFGCFCFCRCVAAAFVTQPIFDVLFVR